MAQQNRSTLMNFASITLVAAIIAAAAATTSAGLGWPVWAMFVGWVAFFTGNHTAKGALSSYLCMAVGIAIGIVAAVGVGALMPHVDYLAFGLVVFVVAVIVVSLRALAPMNNIPAYFLGLIAYFAAHIQPSLPALLELWAVSALGALAAWLVHRLQRAIAKAPAEH